MSERLTDAELMALTAHMLVNSDSQSNRQICLALKELIERRAESSAEG